MRLTIAIAGVLVILSFIAGIYLYPQVPERLDSHWNAQGESDAQSGRLVGLFAMPAIMLVSFLILLLLPKIDPKRNNVEKFRAYYDKMVLVIVAFFMYIHFLSILGNIGWEFDFGIALIPAYFVLFLSIGVLLEKAKPNWFIGIRTPWTLSSERVWNETHRIGARMFKICAPVTLAGFIFREIAIWFVIVPVVVVSVYLVIYSYLIYRKEKIQQSQ